MAMNSMNEVSVSIKTMTSREIAELTGKRHDHVLRDIRTMIDQLKAAPNLGWHCESSTYVDAQGKQREMYLLDKNTTIVLISGYDVVLRMKIVNRWQELESQSPFRIPRTMAEALQLAADQARQIEEQQKQLEAALPMIQFHEEVTASEGEFTIPAVCKTLFDGAVTDTQLRAWLKNQGWMDRRKGVNEPTMWAIRQGYMRLKLNVKIKPGVVVNVPLITAKGLTLLRHLYRTGDLFIATIPIERRLSAPELRV